MRLVERHAELTAARRALERAAGGDGCVLVVRGPAGIGKTSLLQSLTEAAREGGLRVLTAQGDELERELDHGIARQLLERPLRDGPPPTAGPGAAGAAALGWDSDGATVTPTAATHGLHWIVAELAAAAPLALVVDDIQWADASSLRWLVYLSRRMIELPVALALGWRPGDQPDADAVIERLAGQEGAVVVEPAPLSVAGVADVIGNSEIAGALHDATGGNPFLVGELLRAAPSTDELRDMERLDTRAVGASVAARLRRLGADAERVAEAVAVLGDGAELPQAAAVGGLELPAAAAAADALAAAAVFAEEERLRFAHPLVREAVRNALPLQRRAVLHAEAARALAASGAPVERVAAHLRLSPPTADRWAAATLVAAGRAALARGAIDEAIGLLQRARAEPPPAEERAAALGDLALALRSLAREEAEPTLREAIGLEQDVGRRVRLRLILPGLLLQRGGAIDEAAAELEPVVAESEFLDREGAMAARGSLLALRLALHGGDVELPPGLPAKARELPGRTGGERRLLAALAYYHALRGEGTAAECGDLAERALAGGALLDDIGIESAEGVFTILVASGCDRLEASRDFLEVWLDRSRRSGSPVGFAFASQGMAQCLTQIGDVARAEGHADAAREAAGEETVRQPSFVASSIRTLAERGRFDEAEKMLPLAYGSGNEPWPLFATTLAAEAHLRALQGRWQEAADAALAVGERLRARATPSPSLTWRAEAAVALTAVGRRKEALRLATDQQTIADAWGSSRVRGAALRARGIAEGGQAGIALLGEAVEVLARSPSRLDWIRAQVDLGAALRRRKERVVGREVLRQALDLAARGGASVLEARAREEIAATGARPRRVRLTGPASLTPSERRVAELAAAGRSNPEIAQALFVSRRTVETHLGAIYRKLDLSSREQLGEALRAE